MKIQLTAPTIWLATQPTDFRRSINGLSAMVINDYQQTLQDQVYIFYNRAKNKLKILARNRNAAVLVYKQFDKKKLTLSPDGDGLYKITDQQLCWLLAGLDWYTMSNFAEHLYEDFF